MASKSGWFGSFVFGVIALLGAALWFLPAPAIKWGIETYGTEHVGARVDVEDVSFSWLSFALAIDGLQVADPDSPMENLVVIDRLATSLEVEELINKKLYFNELAVEGIALGEARAQSGAVAPQTQADQSEDGSLFAGLGLPSPDELVEKEKAIFERKIDAYREKLESKQKAIEVAINELPNEDTLKSYKKRIDKAKKKAKSPLGNLAALQEFGRIQKDIKRDIKRIEKAQSLIKSTLAELKKDYDLLADLPNQSGEEIVKSLGLEDSVIANAGQMLLAGQFNAWIKQAVNYYGAIIGDGEEKGTIEVATPSAPKTSPDFLIRKTVLSGRLNQGDREGEMSGVILNLNEAPSLSAEPITVDLKAAGVTLGKLLLSGTVDHRKVGSEKDVFEFSVSDGTLENYKLSDQGEMGLLLNKALLSAQANLSVQELSRMNLAVNAAFSQIDLLVDSTKTDEKEVRVSETQQVIVDALMGADEITFKGDAVGSLEKPSLSLTSNLDNILGEAVNKAFQAKLEELKGEVTQRLKQEVAAKLAPLKESLGNINGMQGKAGDRKNAIDELLRKIR